MEDKRNAQRFVEEIDGSISFHDKNDPSISRSVSMKVIDISLHGVRITTSQYLPVYSNLKIALNLTRSNQVLKIDARIAWVKKREDEDSYEMGVEFFHDIKTIENLHKHLYGDG
jgi:hypothetical protein